MRSGDLHPALESHLSKYRKLVPALALLLHLADDGVGPVTATAIARAIAWADYLEPHANRAYASVTASDAMAAQEILRRLRKGDLPPQFSGWEITRKKWSRLSDSKEVEEALQLLVNLGWLRVAVDRETGGRAKTLYNAHPKTLLEA